MPTNEDITQFIDAADAALKSLREKMAGWKPEPVQEEEPLFFRVLLPNTVYRHYSVIKRHQDRSVDVLAVGTEQSGQYPEIYVLLNVSRNVSWTPVSSKEFAEVFLAAREKLSLLSFELHDLSQG